MAPQGTGIHPIEAASKPHRGPSLSPPPSNNQGWREGGPPRAWYPAPLAGLRAPGVPSISIFGRESWIQETRQKGNNRKGAQKGVMAPGGRRTGIGGGSANLGHAPSGTQ